MVTLVAVATGNVVTEPISDSVCMVTLVVVIAANVGLSVYGYSGNTGCSGNR